MSGWRLTSATTGRLAVARLTIADGFCSRFIGLQFQHAMPSDAGILLVPCGAVHTCFMRFALDIVFLDSTGSVLAVRRKVHPWRLAAGPREPCGFGNACGLGGRTTRRGFTAGIDGKCAAP